MNGAHTQVLRIAASSSMRTNRNLCSDPVTLLNPKLGTHIKTRALQDSECSQDFINPALVLGMGLATKNLKEMLTFELMVPPLEGMHVISKWKRSYEDGRIVAPNV